MDLDAEIQKNKAMEGDVQNFQRREALQRNVDDLEKKRVWLEYEVKRQEWMEQKEKLKDKETIVARMQKESAPLAKAEEVAVKVNETFFFS